MSEPRQLDAEAVHFDDRGLVPAIIQDAIDGRVLMMAWMNAESIRLSLETGSTVFWSRSRGELWAKGATSGNVQVIESVTMDCDGDTLLFKVQQVGQGACHTKARSCFDLPPEDDR